MSKNPSSAQSAVEGELSLDDLEKISGGTGLPTDAELAATLAAQNADMLGPVQAEPTVLKQSDNMFTQQIDQVNTGKPMNMTFVR